MSECGDADESRPPSDTETLETALTESRRTFDKSIGRLEEIDDKAMRSVRTAVLLSGLVASAISLRGPDSVSQIGPLPVITGAIGVICLGASIVVGIGIYAATEYPCGARNTHRATDAEGKHTYDEWLVDLLDDYDTWSNELRIETTRNDIYLDIVQFALGMAVVTLLVSSSMIVLEASYGVEPLVTFVATLLLGVVLVVRNKFVSRHLF